MPFRWQAKMVPSIWAIRAPPMRGYHTINIPHDIPRSWHSQDRGCPQYPFILGCPGEEMAGWTWSRLRCWWANGASIRRHEIIVKRASVQAAGSVNPGFVR